MLIVPGISLKSLNPRFWDSNSEYYMPEVRNVMISYADFDASPGQRKRAMDEGIHQFLGIKGNRVHVYLDNGAFHFLMGGKTFREKQYTEFVERARPNWYPVPKDYIPAPNMPTRKQRDYFQRTMTANRTYHDNGFVPIIHVGRYLESYLEAVEKDKRLSAKPEFGLGGLVPNLLRTPNAASHDQILKSIRRVRQVFDDKKIHVFGIGGVSTIHVAALLGLDSVDSSGWRNRAARGIVQLPGRGDRMVTKLGTWNIRQLSRSERSEIEGCACPACSRYGFAGLKAKKVQGFRCRAIHNLYILFQESKLIEQHLRRGDYADWYPNHLSNSIYKPIVDDIFNIQRSEY